MGASVTSLILVMSTVTLSAASHESHIGPPSLLIHIGDFLREARNDVAHASMASDLSLQALQSVDPVLQDDIAAECWLVSQTSDMVTSRVNAAQV